MNTGAVWIGSTKSVEDLVREDIERQTLENAARKLETQGRSEVYRKAFKAAASILREMKP